MVFPGEAEEESGLGRRLVRGGLVSEENWKKARQQHQEGLQGIEKVLVEGGMVTKEDMTAALRLLTFDAIYGLFKWKGGNFRFDAQPVSFHRDFVEPLASEYLLLDVLRMIDEWPMIEKRLPSFDAALQKTNPLASLDVLTGTPWEKSRTFQMEVIYDLLDGQRSIREIIEQSFVEEFETCKCLTTLMDAGLIEAAAGPVSNGREKKEREKLHLSKYLASGGAYGFVAVLALVLLFQFLSIRGSHFPLNEKERAGWRILLENREKMKNQNEQNTREIFFLQEKAHPLPREISAGKTR